MSGVDRSALRTRVGATRKKVSRAGAAMKRLGIAIAAAGLASFAHAADLPTTKASDKAKPNCWASVWDWLNTSAADCPISAYGVTLYGTLDVNAAYLHEGVDRSPAADKV